MSGEARAAEVREAPPPARPDLPPPAAGVPSRVAARRGAHRGARRARLPGAPWRRRLAAGTRVLLAALAVAAWGKFLYVGWFRLWARDQEWAIGGHWALDTAAVCLGALGSLHGALALWALLARRRRVGPRGRGPT
jgi:hypothetical protein